jgi:hypothetical protein
VLIVEKVMTKSFNLRTLATPTILKRCRISRKRRRNLLPGDWSRPEVFSIQKQQGEISKADPYDRSQYVRGMIYDEYIPEDFYYAVMPDKSVHPFKLNKRNLFKAFPAEQSKIEAYISAHADDKIDDVFLED